jgi:hypothetical protein
MLTISLVMLLAAAQAPQNAAPTAPAGSEAVNVAVSDSAKDAALAKNDAQMSKVVCRSQPVLGSRLKKGKVCKTLAEWNLDRLDKAQLKRDINSIESPVAFEGPGS